MKSPKKGATKKMATDSFQPTTPPIIPISFTSPKPIASFLSANLPRTLQRNMRPPPTSVPIIDAMKASSQLIPIREKVLKVCGALCRSEHARLRMSASGIPARVTSLGIINNSRSTKVDIIRAQQRAR